MVPKWDQSGRYASKLSFWQHSLLLAEQGVKPLSGQVMVLPSKNDLRQITSSDKLFSVPFC